MNADTAEMVALQALGWLAADEDLWPAFLGMTGAAAEDAAGRIGDPAFLASVLDFVTLDDARVVAFCDFADLAYDLPLRARHALPGAERVEWT